MGDGQETRRARLTGQLHGRLPLSPSSAKAVTATESISSGLRNGAVTGALKHVVEDVIKKTGLPGVSQVVEKMMLEELKDVVIGAANKGLQNGTKMYVRTAYANWELIFDTTGPIPRLYHAVPK